MYTTLSCSALSVWIFGSITMFHTIIIFYRVTTGKWDSISLTLCNVIVPSVFQPQHTIKFSCKHQCVNRTTQLFTQPPRCHLSFIQHFFHFKAIHWRNAVPNDILISATFKDDLFLQYICANFLQLFLIACLLLLCQCM